MINITMVNLINFIYNRSLVLVGGRKCLIKLKQKIVILAVYLLNAQMDQELLPQYLIFYSNIIQTLLNQVNIVVILKGANFLFVLNLIVRISWKSVHQWKKTLKNWQLISQWITNLPMEMRKSEQLFLFQMNHIV